MLAVDVSSVMLADPLLNVLRDSQNEQLSPKPTSAGASYLATLCRSFLNISQWHSMPTNYSFCGCGDCKHVRGSSMLRPGAHKASQLTVGS